MLCIGAGVLASPAVQAQPSYTVSAGQLQQAVAARFPQRYPVGGLLALNIQAPSLRLIPATNRLGAAMAVDATGPALDRSYMGTFDVDFLLRYEASDMSIRATQLRVNTLRLSGLPPEVSMLLGAYGASLAEQTLLEVVVHRLEKKDLAMADLLGLEPGKITVTDQGVVVGFVNKPVGRGG